MPSRRRNHLLIALSIALALPPGGAADAQDCPACGVREAPRKLSSSTVIAPPGEPGERLVISGTVFRADGRTPAPGVVVYAYHTNAAGIYPKRGNERGYARWHGYLRGWVRSDARGRYEFRTIRAATYPSRVEPAHVHLEVRTPNGREYDLTAIVDSADPLVTPEYRRLAARINTRGGEGIVPFRRDSAGVWHARRDIVLEP